MAMCPVRLGETDDSFANLLAAEDYAQAHAQYIANSWGGSAFSGEAGYDWHLVQSRVSFFVSAGTTGCRPNIPRR